MCLQSHLFLWAGCRCRDWHASWQNYSSSMPGKYWRRSSLMHRKSQSNPAFSLYWQPSRHLWEAHQKRILATAGSQHPSFLILPMPKTLCWSPWFHLLFYHPSVEQWKCLYTTFTIRHIYDTARAGRICTLALIIEEIQAPRVSAEGSLKLPAVGAAIRCCICITVHRVLKTHFQNVSVRVKKCMVLF